MDTKAPLSEFYPQEVIDILTSGADKFSRWGITQGQGDLVGASLGELPVPKAIGDADRPATPTPPARPSRPPTSSGRSRSHWNEPVRRRRRRRPTGHRAGGGERRAGLSAAPGADSGAADARAGLILISPTLVIVIVMVVLPILWTFSMAFQRIRLLNLRSAGIFGDYTLDNFRGIFTSEGFWTSLRDHTDLLGVRDGFGDRPRSGRRAGPAQSVPRPDVRPGRDAAALRRAGRGGDVRLEHDAQPAVRHRELLGTAAAGLGRADRVPEPGQRVRSASRPPCSR